MRTLQAITDKFSISLSMLCAIHCLLLPVILTLAPSIGVLQLQDERFHLWMLIAVIPVSLFALTMGCKKHKKYRLFGLGFLGLTLLTLAILLGHDVVGETGEKLLTFIGSCFVVAAHFSNFRSCQQHDDCAC